MSGYFDRLGWYRRCGRDRRERDESRKGKVTRASNALMQTDFNILLQFLQIWFVRKPRTVVHTLQSSLTRRNACRNTCTDFPHMDRPFTPECRLRCLWSAARRYDSGLDPVEDVGARRMRRRAPEKPTERCEVFRLRQPVRFEPPHLARRRARTFRCFATDDPAHGGARDVSAMRRSRLRIPQVCRRRIDGKCRRAHADRSCPRVYRQEVYSCLTDAYR